MTSTPDGKPGDNPRPEASDYERDPTPGEVLALVAKWLRVRLKLSADRPKWTDVITTILTVAVATAAIASAWLFQRQLTVARATLEAQTRPWVGTGKIEVKQTMFQVYPENPPEGRTQVDLVIDVPIKDVGNSPALHVEMMIHGTMTKETVSPPTMDTMMESACGWADGNSARIGQVLFPNSPETKLEWPVNLMTPFIELTDVHRVWIAICIAYRGTSSDQKVHHTKIWMASWPINGKPTEIRSTTQPRVIYFSLPVTQWSVVKTEAD